MVNWSKLNPFNRTQNQQTGAMSPELQQYYQAEQRDKKGRAWLLGIATVVVTILLSALLFFGGRWVYRAIFSDDESTTTTQEEQETTDTAGEPEQAPRDESPSTDTPSVPDTDREEPRDVAGETDDESPATPGRGTADDDLPDTGPASTLAIVASVSGLAAAGHYAVTKKRSR